ncbi:hypothetical protein KQY30_24830 [Streptomyces sp. GMY02]|uniref:hypothetical protein n=1 Tax=Streptomyces sp. GMY02 TaxID=1333528 RepID=UPI001C2BED66|nr:hypothetical protein [Streptomyces sp. GMY02]QXE36953.1 hypothetical protein KQY30_24830 [Streptomyces sp. GMY02]
MVGTPGGDRRERYAAAIRPAMLIGLQGADLSGPAGAERINAWVDWIADTLALLGAGTEADRG